jgi:hypothetical protein
MTTGIQPASLSPASKRGGQSAPARPSLQLLAATGRKLDVQDPAVVQRTAAQFVSELFFAPALAEVRAFPLHGNLADGGRTEAIFGEQLDQQIADRVAAASPRLVNDMARRLQPRDQNAAPGTDRVAWPVQMPAVTGTEEQAA